MRQIKWGVLGCADFARQRAIPAMILAEGVELFGIASRSLEKAQGFAKEFGFKRAYGSYEEMLADPEIEAVYNPLPNGMHPEWALKAALAGKHSIVEKPFASNASEIEPVIAAAKEKNVKIMEAFMWRFHPMNIRARQLVREGAIGELRFFRTAFTFMLERGPNVRLDAALGGGGIMDVGCYCISQARFFFESEPTKVYCRADLDPVYKVDTLASAILEFPGGRACFDAGFDLPFRCEYEIVGSKGRILCPVSMLPPEEPFLIIEPDGGTRTFETFESVNQWTLEFEHLSKCIVDGTRPDYDLEDALKQQRTIDAVYRSIGSGSVEAV